MNKKIFSLIGAAILGVATTSHAAGVQIDTTRIVIEDGQKSKSFGLLNDYEVPLLANVTVTSFDDKPTNAFAVSPSLYQVKPKTTFKSKVIQLESLPADRESVFWLNVKTVLSDSEDGNGPKNKMGLAIAQRIKLFYRPKNLKENCESAVENLKWIRTNNGLKAINDSGVSVSIVNISENGKEIPIGDTVLPKTNKSWSVKLSETSEKIDFTYVDEYGNFKTHPITIK